MQDEEKVKKAALKAKVDWWKNNVIHSVVAPVLWLLIHQHRASLSQMQISLSPIDNYPFQITALTGLKVLFACCLMLGFWSYLILGAVFLILIGPTYIFLKLSGRDFEAIKIEFKVIAGALYLAISWVLILYIV